MLLKSASILAIAACLMSATQVKAQATPASDAPIAKADSAPQEIVVIGGGQTRSVSTLLPSSLDTLPPGTSVQKALNFLPGVMAQSIDALGVNEQSLSLQVRGFSSTHLGYTLDGMPLGDGAYNNYNGLTISRALISENLGRADLATGIAGLSIASTSNLGGALLYTSSNPHKDFGFTASQTLGSDIGRRTYLRLDSGEYNGFSLYLSGQYAEQNLFVQQTAYNTSTEGQFNGKAQYRFDRGLITAFADISRTNQADDPYLSKDELARRGPDVGGLAPDWQTYLSRAACSVPSLIAKCVTSTLPEKLSDVTFTNGQILRNDDLFYIAGDYDITRTLKAHAQLYRHTDDGDGNNFIAGLSTQGTATTADDLPVQVRDTRYTIERDGVLANLAWDVSINHIQGGFWLERNTSSAVRYIRINVTGPFDLGSFISAQPDQAQWDQKTRWSTQQFYLQDTVSLFRDAVSIDFGVKSTDATSDATALTSMAKTPPPVSTQFATGSLKAKDSFLPEAGARWRFAPGNELYVSYAENQAMFQGGFKLGPQSVTQAIWNVQGATLKPETSRTFDAGYRYVSGPLQATVAIYHVNFDNRLLQYNPCPTNLQQNPGCGNSFHNAGSVTSNGVELSALWRLAPWLTWYNSYSFNKTTYDSDLNFCTTTCIIEPTDGKQQVDTPRNLISSVLTLKKDGFWASLQGKYTGQRFYTYTNDQGFGAYTTFDLGLGYTFDRFGVLRGAKLALNVTNLTDKRYIANFDNSVFAPTDPTGTVLVAHSAAPRQFFGTISVDF